MHELHSQAGWLLDHVQDPGSVALTTLQITSLSNIPGDVSGSIELHLSDSKYWIPVLVSRLEIEALCLKFKVTDASALRFSLIDVEKIELKTISLSSLKFAASGLFMRRIGEYDLTLGSPTPLRETAEWKVIEDEWLMKNAPFKFSEFKGCIPAEQAFPVRLLPFATLLTVDTLVEDIIPDSLLDDSDEVELISIPPSRTLHDPRPAPAQLITHEHTPTSSQSDLDRSVSQRFTQASRQTPPPMRSSQPSREPSFNLTQESTSQRSQASASSKPNGRIDQARPASQHSHATPPPSQHAYAIPPESQPFDIEEEDHTYDVEYLGPAGLNFGEPPSMHSQDELSETEESEESEEAPAPPKKKSRMISFGGMDDESEDDSSEESDDENSLESGRALPNARKHTFQPFSHTKPKEGRTEDVRNRYRDEPDLLDEDDLPTRKHSSNSRLAKR